MLQIEESSNCHGYAPSATDAILQLSSNVRFNRCSKIHVDEDSSQHEAKAM
jgi:hypothetical protein